MNTKPNNPEWQAFLKECQTDKRILLITKTLDRHEVLGLINACNAYLSLHRAEGFGRTLAEAMLLGKPVIATNYSGNVDFLKYSEIPGVNYEIRSLIRDEYQWVEIDDNGRWAEPDIKHASLIMNNVMERFRRNLSNSAKIDHFMVKNISEKIINGLLEYE